MGQITSKDIEKMLTLLENKDKQIRKLTLIVICYLLKNGRSKVYFLEKCGLGLRVGKIFLSRLKYLTLNIKEIDTAIDVLNRVSMKSRVDMPHDALFWYIPLVTAEKHPIDVSQVCFYQFYEASLELDNLDEIKTDNIPDPIYNLCGFNLTLADIQSNSTALNAMENSKILDNSGVTQESLLISSRFDNQTAKPQTSITSIKKTPNTKPRNITPDMNDDDKSFKSQENVSQYSALKKSHISPFKSRDKVANRKFGPVFSKPREPSVKVTNESRYGVDRRVSKLIRSDGNFSC